MSDDQAVNVPYVNTPATANSAIPASRQAPFSQTTHPSTNAHGPAAPEARHPGDLPVNDNTTDTAEPRR
ncbi:MAG: hypothetical protein ACRYFU_11950 [Janthinobacterium lividum]